MSPQSNARTTPMHVARQSVSWQRAVLVPVSVALIIAGTLLRTLPFSSVRLLGVHTWWRTDADWERVRRLGALSLLGVGAAGLALLVLSR